MSISGEHTPRSPIDPVDPGYTEAVILEGYNLVPEPGKYFCLIDQAAMGTYRTLITEWQTRADLVHAPQEQDRTSLKDGLGVHYQEITLYHGGATSGITEFRQAEDATIGSGLYATSMPDQAFGYALARADPREKIENNIASPKPDPVVYELSLKDISLIDLRKGENITTTLQGYAGFLENYVRSQREAGDLPYWRNTYLDIVEEKIADIYDSAGGDPPHLKHILQQTGTIFTRYIASLGYDGIIAYEGGEGAYTSTHDSYMIIDPAKAQVTSQVTFTNPRIFDRDAFNTHSANNRPRLT